MPEATRPSRGAPSHPARLRSLSHYLARWRRAIPLMGCESESGPGEDRRLSSTPEATVGLNLVPTFLAEQQRRCW
jgi:hypothetical protein